MPRFRVKLNGENFLLARESGPARMGFYTNRFVDAEDAQAAELIAVQLIRDDPRLRSVVLNNPSNPPLIFAEQVEEIDFQMARQHPNQGYTFYSEETSSPGRAG